MAIKRPDFAGSVGSNILSDDDYELLNSYNKGFQPDNVIVSSYVNSLLREFSLLSGAVESYALNDPGFNLGINNTQEEWSNKFKEGINNKIANTMIDSVSLYKKSITDSNTNDIVDILYWGNPSNPEAEKSIEITNARNATKLQTARSIQVDLASSNSASFNGTEDAYPGVKGVLPEGSGGTGKSNLSDVIVGKAKKIYTETGIGNQTNPVYVDNDGSIKSCLHSLNADVPSDAKFTDTWRPLGKGSNDAAAGNHSHSNYYDTTLNHIECYYDDVTVTIPDNELEQLMHLSDQILFLKLNYTNRPLSDKYDILKLVSAVKAIQPVPEGATDDYTFANNDKIVTISIKHISQTLDSIIISNTSVSKATYADKAEYAIKNANNSYSKLTQDSNSVLKVDDTYIISKKKLLWSGSVNIRGTNFKDIYTPTDSLKGKKLEIWVRDRSSVVNLFFGPITLKIGGDVSKYDVYYDTCNISTLELEYGRISICTVRFNYNPNDNKISGQSVVYQYNIPDKTYSKGEYTCYVEAIYEIIE